VNSRKVRPPADSIKGSAASTTRTVIERTVDLHGLRGRRPDARKEVSEVVADRERRRREDPGAALRSHQLAEARCDLEWRVPERETGTPAFGPTQPVVLGGIRDGDERIAQLRRAPRRLPEAGIVFLRAREFLRRPAERVPHAFERADEALRQGRPFHPIGPGRQRRAGLGDGRLERREPCARRRVREAEA